MKPEWWFDRCIRFGRPLYRSYHRALKEIGWSNDPTHAARRATLRRAYQKARAKAKEADDA